MTRERLHRTTASLLVAAALAAPFLAASSGDGDLPPAEQLLDRHVEATGGLQAHRKHHTRIAVGRLDVDVAGHRFDARVEEQRVAPDRCRVLYEGPHFAQLSVCDGEHAWEWRPGGEHGGSGGGPEAGETWLLEGARLDQALDRARFLGDAEWRERYARVETLGIVEVDGSAAYEVRVETRAGEERLHYYDVESGRLVQRVRTNPSEHGDVRVEAHLLDYREFDGVWIPTRVRAVLSSPSFGEGLQTWTYTSFEHDVEVPDALFELPEELRAPAPTDG